MTSFDVTAVAAASGAGTASLSFPIPNDKALLRLVFHNQYVVADQKANALGLVFSNGGSAFIGAQ